MCHESARYMSCAAVSQKGVGSCCHERDFAPSLALRALVVHFSAGRSQRPLGVTVEDSPVPALLFSGCLRARVGRVRLGRYVCGVLPLVVAPVILYRSVSSPIVLSPSSGFPFLVAKRVGSSNVSVASNSFSGQVSLIRHIFPECQEVRR